MYSLFINNVLIESSRDFDVLKQKRYSKILELLEDGYEYADDSDNYHYNSNAVIELIKADDTKELSILWSGNTVNDVYDAYNTNDIEENADTIKDQNENTGIDINNFDINNDTINNDTINNDTINDNNSIDNNSIKNDTVILNDSSSISADSNNSDNDSDNVDKNTNINTNKSAIKNTIINTIVNALNTLEYDSAFIPSKTLAQQVQKLFNNQEYILYKQQLFTSILAGKSEHEIIIPIKQNDDLVDIYTLCYVLIIRGYQFNLNVDDEYKLHIQITW